VNRVERVVLIAHQGCAYYQPRLGIAPAEIEAGQREDLYRAAWAVRRTDSALEIRGFYTRRVESHIRFEPVMLSPEEARSGTTVSPRSEPAIRLRAPRARRTARDSRTA
jgi:hypothetical protein